MIEFAKVSKSFWTGKQRKVILDRASFRVELGNSLGILAPNGTGKTTLINMMAGLEKPDEGDDPPRLPHLVPAGLHGRRRRRHTVRHGKQPLHRPALRARPRLCRGVLPLALRASRNISTCRSAPIRGHAGAFHFCADAGAGFRYLPDRRRHARDHRCGIQPQGRRNPARPAGEGDRHHRLAPAGHAGKFARSAAVLRDGQLYMFDTLEEAKQLYDYETQG